MTMRRRLGASALGLEAESDSCEHASWRPTVAARLPCQSWPTESVEIVAVDASTGVPVVFGRHSDVGLADAVAARCSSGLRHRIGERHYLDGGYRRSSENADLAAGYERVPVLSPLGGRTRAPWAWGMQLATQVEELRVQGSSVETVFPDESSRNALGDNLTGLSSRVPAARAGYEQGGALAGQLADF